MNSKLLDKVSNFLKSNGHVISDDDLISLFDWDNIVTHYKLDDNFINNFLYVFDRQLLSIYQKLSEEFIERHIHSLDKIAISTHQKLSEEFIQKHFDSLKPKYIYKYQQLSEEFIEKNKHKYFHLWFEDIANYQKLSEEFIYKHKLEVSDDNWLYKDEQFKLEELKKCGLYEISEDQKSFIAYKGVKYDRHSMFNFQYQYLKDNIYECHADHTVAYNSFGLNVWSEENVRGFNPDEIIKVEIQVKDIARIAGQDGKIRCTKLKVLT